MARLGVRGFHWATTAMLLVLTASDGVLAQTVPDRAGQRPRHVLLLNSYHQGMQWTDQVTAAVQDVFAAEGLAVDLHVENMDVKRRFDDPYLVALADFFRIKHVETSFDLIVSSDNAAFDFLLRFHDELFPGVPTVFCGVNFFQDAQIRNHPDFTGVAEVFDARGTLAVVKELFPEARRVFVIHDDTETGQAWANSIRQDCAGLDVGLDVEFSPPMTMQALEERLRSLPEDAVGLLTVFFRDASRTYFAPEQAVATLSRACPRPIFGLLDFQLGQGVLGGKLIGGYYQGETAARIGARILRGEAPRDIPVVKKGADRLLFDSEQMRRFHVSAERLPPGSVVVNEPPSFYREHVVLIWAGLAFIGLESLIIVVLGINVRRRRRAETNYRDMFENAANGILQNTPDGAVVNVNPALAAMFGFESVGQTLAEVKDVSGFYENPGQREQFLRLLRERGRVLGRELRLLRRDGSSLTASVDSRAVYGKKGRLVLVESFFTDISDRKRAEEAILRAKAEAESASRMKSALLASVSHELRTPLTSILGFMKIVEGKLDRQVFPRLPANDAEAARATEQIKANCAVIQHEGERLTRLIDAVLELTGLVSETRPPVLSRLSPAQILEPAVAAHREAARAKGLELVLEIDPDAPDVGGDPGRLRRAAGILIANAVKFSSNGRVSCRAQAGKDATIFSVRDQGPGVAPEHSQAIFEGFRQIGDLMTDKPGGLGLGLAICKAIVAAHGGEAGVASEPGQGSKFFFTIPAWKPKAGD